MQNTKREFLGILCSIYMVVMLAVLPLYMTDGYYRLGDAKYVLFRNVTILCVGIWLAWELFCGICLVYEPVKEKAMFQGQRAGAFKRQGGDACKRHLGAVDIFVLGYGVCALLSAVCSHYDTAWMGYQDWNMGALSQLLFVGIYFLISGYYGYDRIPLYAGEVAFLAVVGIGLLNRLGLDPLKVFEGFSARAWEYSHMLSTIGNINWFCGYCSVALALPLTGYLYSNKRIKSSLLYTVSVLGMTLLAIQGSDSGPVLWLAALAVCMMAGVKKTILFQKGWALLSGSSACIWLMGKLVVILDAREANPVDSWMYERLGWNGWLAIAVAAGIGYVAFGKIGDRFGEAVLRKVIKIFLAVAGLTTATIVIFLILQWRTTAFAEWGNGRGQLWRLAWEGFLEASPGKKLIGVGPDCYAEYLGSLGKTPVITDEGHWANAIFANAHNEWLNLLVNMGLVGVTCYTGIFLSALKRYRGMLLGVLVLAMYGVHSLVSFQQVLNTPLLFMLLGICENCVRRHEKNAAQQAGDADDKNIV